jgi:alpha-L-rhamnosidase
MIKKILVILYLFHSSLSNAQSIQSNHSSEVNSNFKAAWIAPPNVSLKEYGVYHFRKELKLAAKPSSFTIRISADNRYRLYINEISVVSGPQRSDVSHWRYETLDIAPYLKQGKNIIAVQVWNQGEAAAWAQLSFQTGLWIEGAGAAAVLNTDSSWKVLRNNAYTPIVGKLHITGPFDNVNAAWYPWGWQGPDYNDQEWEWAIETEKAKAYENSGKQERQLVARNIPLMEEKMQSFGKIRRAEGIKVDDSFLQGKSSLQIPANRNTLLLIDQGVLTTAYPELLVSGGKDCKITATYAEALFSEENDEKGNRNEIESKSIRGDKDIFIPDGGNKRLFRPLYYRTFRYVELKIENRGAPLTIHRYNSQFTAYPFHEKGRFQSNDAKLGKIWDVGWRTSRLCAFETYMDCPYYEQLQYIGDTRIQALISLYVSGDARLMKNAIEQFDDSRTQEGLTLSRYPSNMRQIIPPFSLFWTAMVHDYWMHRDDSAFVARFLPGIKQTLNWHASYVNNQAMLSKMPYCNFVDWPKEWPWKGDENISGIPAGALEGNSAILTFQFVYALNNAVDIFKANGKLKEAKEYEELAAKLSMATYKACWDNAKGMMADTPDKTEFSQHVNAMAVLAGAIPQKDEKNLLLKIEKDTSIIQCTIYYRFYLMQAFKKAGLGNEYTRLLKPWHHMIDLGLTTFAERPEPTRSDCHAWSASPCYDLLATVCGIEPAEPGFKKVRIAPNFGDLEWIHGSMAHQSGNIIVNLKKKNEYLSGNIDLPPGVDGVLVWHDKIVNLNSGKQTIEVDEK